MVASGNHSLPGTLLVLQLQVRLKTQSPAGWIYTDGMDGWQTGTRFIVDISTRKVLAPPFSSPLPQEQIVILADMSDGRRLQLLVECQVPKIKGQAAQEAC
jgi:hypothetical protein